MLMIIYSKNVLAVQFSIYFTELHCNCKSIKNYLKIFQHVIVSQMVHLILTVMHVLIQLVAHAQTILEYALVQMGTLGINAIIVTLVFMMKMVMELTAQQYVQVFHTDKACPTVE